MCGGAADFILAPVVRRGSSLGCQINPKSFMGGFYESFERALGKPAVQIVFATATLIFSVAAVFLDLVDRTACIAASCLAAASLITFCASLWCGRLSGRRKLADELKLRAEAQRRVEPD